MRLLILLTGLLATFTVDAQEELRFSSGATHETGAESTYGWQLDYAQGLSEHSYLSLGWLNEGHPLNNHRDGLDTQLWAHADFFGSRLSLAAGIGPYFFFDTVRDEAHPSFAPYADEHGVGTLYSGEIGWCLDQSWLLYLRASRIDAEIGSNTSMLFLGVGYRFDGRSVPDISSIPAGPASAVEPLDDELAVFLGRTFLNSFTSERSTAYAVEYRLSVSRHLDWTLGALNEGGNDIIRRNGLTSQLWLVSPQLDDRLELGIGAGAYIVVNQQDQTFVVMHHQVVGVASDDDRLSGIVSFTARYRFGPHWFIRGSFNRLVTNYDRDADILLFGGGYRF